MAENNNISGVEAIRQLIEAQKNWHVFRAKKENNKNTIYVGGTSLTEEELVGIKAGGQIPSEGLTYELSEDKTYAICTGLDPDVCKENNIVIASIYRGKPVTSICDWAFSGRTSLTSVEIPNSVTSIGTHAFYNCSSLENMIIPDSITSIGAWAFHGCSSITSIKIPDSVESIGGSAFQNCTIFTSIEIPNSVTSIGTHAFYDCTSLTIYCEAESKPEGWNDYWNYSNRPVAWGVALDIPAVNDRIVSVENNIGDIEAALDSILAIQRELLSESNITFYIINNYAGDITQTHTALEGMTWYEWCDSEYNTIGMYCNHEKGNVYAPDGIGVLQEQGTSNTMFGDKIIVAEQTYRLS